MNAVVENVAPINFTDSAANKVRELIEEEGNPSLKLRVFVTGGGCSVFSMALRLTRKSLMTIPQWRKTGCSC